LNSHYSIAPNKLSHTFLRHIIFAFSQRNAEKDNAEVSDLIKRKALKTKAVFPREKQEKFEEAEALFNPRVPGRVITYPSMTSLISIHPSIQRLKIVPEKKRGVSSRTS